MKDESIYSSSIHPRENDYIIIDSITYKVISVTYEVIGSVNSINMLSNYVYLLCSESKY